MISKGTVIWMASLIASYDLKRSSGKKVSRAKGNEMVSANDRLHHILKHQLTSHLRALALETDFSEQGFSEQEPLPVFTRGNPCHIIVVVHPPTNRRMDSPNWYPTVKPLIDGLTDAGIFADDDDEVITSVTFLPGEKTTTKKYRIDLHIIAGILDIEGV